ncbi:MAG: diaminopimelate decarboxylase [Bacteroidaceae bacterium]|nr:diaminopimelate decarboxylase [Bacteroidaceae bacterium]
MNDERRTPYYIYNSKILQRTLCAINAARDERQHVHYAIKANANPLVLEHIRQAGLGVDCVSGGEVQRAIEVGFDPAKIVFAGIGKADWEIRLALKAGIGCFNVESMPELEVINELALEAGVVARVALRINPNVDAHTHAKITTGLNENKFGLAMEDMQPAIRRASELRGVEYVGLHFHIGSQITEFEPFRLLAERINELQDELEQAGITTTRTINVGGGLGIDYEHPDDCPVPDFESYFRTFREALQLRPHQEMHCELGRAVVAQCGCLISRVLYVKEGHQKKFVICDAGMTDLVRPAMYGSYHQCDNLTAQQDQRTTDTYDVVGPICESSDVFLKGYQMPTTRRGDLLAFRSAGAYGEIMASQYNCRSLPASYME